MNNSRQKIYFFTRVLGYTPEETKDLLIACPQLVTPSVKQNLLPKFYYLWQNALLETETLRTAIKKNPKMLLHSLNKNLKPKLEYFRDKLGVEPEAMNKLMSAYPMIFNYKLEKTLIPLTDYFVNDLGFSITEFRKIILKFPRLATYSFPCKIRHVVGMFKYEIELDACKIKRVLYQAPQVMGFTDTCLREKIDYLRIEVLGGGDGTNYSTTDKQMLIKLVSGMPTLLLCSIENNLAPKVAYLRATFDHDEEIFREAIVIAPTLLGYSLEKRITPRVESLKRIGEDVRRITVGIGFTDEKFEQWIESLGSNKRKTFSRRRKQKIMVTMDRDEEVEEEGRGGRIVTWTRPRKIQDPKINP